MESIQLDTSRIPRFRREQLGIAAIFAMEAYFAKPGVEEEYQRWLAEQVAEQTEEGGETS